VLGAAAAKLDTHVTALYVNARCVRAHGRMDVQRGASMAARLCCALMRLPTAGRDIPVTLAIGRHGNAERWWRRFGDDRPLVTSQHLAADGALVKRYGVIELRFVVSSCGGGLRWRSIATRVRIGPVAVRLPAPLQPTVHAVALPTDYAGIWVRVRITAPIIGRLVTYHGTIEQEKDHAYRALAARRTRRGRRLRHPLVP
jgi:hypothetical protein